MLARSKGRGELAHELHARHGVRAHLVEPADEAEDVLAAADVALKVERVVLRVQIPALALAVLHAELAHPTSLLRELRPEIRVGTALSHPTPEWEA